PVLEDAGFWDGIRATPANGTLLTDASAVVLPAWLEDQPRRLLQAMTWGIPVVATDGCGLDGLSQVRTVKTGDAQALKDALVAILAKANLANEAASAHSDPYS